MKLKFKNYEEKQKQKLKKNLRLIKKYIFLKWENWSAGIAKAIRCANLR